MRFKLGKSLDEYVKIIQKPMFRISDIALDKNTGHRK